MQDMITADVVCDGNVHVMPEQDYIEHVESDTCLCAPKLEIIPPDLSKGIADMILFYTHNALSGEPLG